MDLYYWHTTAAMKDFSDLFVFITDICVVTRDRLCEGLTRAVLCRLI